MKKKNKIKMLVTSLLACICLSGCALVACDTVTDFKAMIEQMTKEALESGTLEKIPYQDPAITELLDKGYSIEEANSILREEASSSSTPSTPTTTPKPACSHEWAEEVVKQATCTEAGSVKKTCSKCKEATTVKVAKLEHDYQPTETVDGTCETIGYVVQTCTLCGDSFKVETDYGTHLFFPTEVVKETCETEGCVTKTCEVCGVETYETVEALGHKMTATKVVIEEATCETAGVKAYKCQNEDCDLVTEEETIPATGHTEGDTHTIEKATFFGDGYAETFCADCSKVLKTETLPATGGVWRYVVVFGASVVIGVSLGIVARLSTKKKRV